MTIADDHQRRTTVTGAQSMYIADGRHATNEEGGKAR
jgi:hypothetical protein